jgi:ankyrin repeat protein
MQGSSLQWKTYLGWTPLHFAAMQSNVELVDWMLSEGSDALATGEDGCMPGDCATHPEVRKTLFKTGTQLQGLQRMLFLPHRVIAGCP